MNTSYPLIRWVFFLFMACNKGLRSYGTIQKSMRKKIILVDDCPFFFRPSGMLCSEDQPGEGYVYDSDSFIKIISGSLGPLGTK